ncbi:hypothetical protein L917_06851, partial [Phytophthora nicotianae]
RLGVCCFLFTFPSSCCTCVHSNSISAFCCVRYSGIFASPRVCLADPRPSAEGATTSMPKRSASALCQSTQDLYFYKLRCKNVYYNMLGRCWGVSTPEFWSTEE